MKFSIPVSVNHFTPGSVHNVSLKIEIPKYNFSTVQEISVTATSELMPTATIDFEAFTSKDPQKMIITYAVEDEWATCIVYRPIIENNRGVAPVVQTISQKKDGIEISTEIENLHPAYNFRNWVNVWLKKNESVTIRYFCDTLLTKDAYLNKNL